MSKIMSKQYNSGSDYTDDFVAQKQNRGKNRELEKSKKENPREDNFGYEDDGDYAYKMRKTLANYR